MKLGPKQQKWVDALRSGKYEQGNSYLCRNKKYCCLGVACELFVKDNKKDFQCHDKEIVNYFGHSQSLPNEILELLKIKNLLGAYINEYNNFLSINGTNNLAQLNDSKQLTFAEIADFIEQNAQFIFYKPA